MRTGLQTVSEIFQVMSLVLIAGALFLLFGTNDEGMAFTVLYVLLIIPAAIIFITTIILTTLAAAQRKAWQAAKLSSTYCYRLKKNRQK